MKDFDLLSQLKNYVPFDDVEKGYVDSTIDFLEHGENQFDRSNLEKHIVADAYLLSSNLDKILLTHHKFLGFWLPFGGHSDGDKNSLHVALREAFEESGIENIDFGEGKIFDVDIHTIPENPKKNEPEHKHIDIRFVFTTPEQNFVVSDESDSLAWFTIEEFEKMISNASYFSGTSRVISKLNAFIRLNKGKNPSGVLENL